jgi:hypothetical protein
MRSPNPAWRVEDFHARIARLAEIGAGQRVLDLGSVWIQRDAITAAAIWMAAAKL